MIDKPGASFQIFLRGGRDALASAASLISREVRCGGGGAIENFFFFFTYFMCFLKPHEQGISAKIWYKN